MPFIWFANLPPAYITANIIEEIQETLLLDASKMISISLKNTVMDLGNAYENPIEIKAPTTTAQPHPPSGGVYPTGPPIAAGILTEVIQQVFKDL